MKVDDATLVLGIETSCDETAAALVMGGYDVVSSAVSTQIDLHAQYGGVVPEIAGRAHLDLINPMVARAIVEAGVAREGARLDTIREIMSRPEYTIVIDLGLGSGEDAVMTSDLSEEYVRINAKYTT